MDEFGGARESGPPDFPAGEALRRLPGLRRAGSRVYTAAEQTAARADICSGQTFAGQRAAESRYKK